MSRTVRLVLKFATQPKFVVLHFKFLSTKN